MAIITMTVLDRTNGSFSSFQEDTTTSASNVAVVLSVKSSIIVTKNCRPNCGIGRLSSPERKYRTARAVCFGRGMSPAIKQLQFARFPN